MHGKGGFPPVCNVTVASKRSEKMIITEHYPLLSKGIISSAVVRQNVLGDNLTRGMKTAVDNLADYDDFSNDSESLFPNVILI